MIIRDTPRPVDWAIENFRLSTAYARPGEFRPHRWQIEPINAIADYDEVIYCKAVQIGGSLMAEIGVAWCIDCYPMNAMLCYAKRETVQDVFADRLKPMIKEIPAISKYWSGEDDDLTQKKIKLAHMYIRVASAEVKSDIATWSCGLVYGSEVAKYRKKKGWNPVKSLKGRQEAYRIIGRHKTIIESSPEVVGDCLYEEMYRPGVLIVRPHFPCRSCGKYQVITRSRIRELPNDKRVYDHDPERIRDKKAVRYLCVNCGKQINEDDRIWMCDRVVWAGDGETIRDGVVVNRKKTRTIAFQIPRFVDYSYTFHECLARWFEAVKKGHEDMQTSTNEDEAEFWQEQTIQVSGDYLLSRRHKSKYRQFVPGEIPDDVMILLLGADVQDDGFYYVMNGYGRGMNKYVIRAGFIESGKNLSEAGKDPHQLAYERFRAGVFGDPYIRKDGKALEMYFGFIDRGGHRPEDVDYICERIPGLKAYIGSPRPDFKKDFVEESRTGSHYMGQSMRLSREVTQIMDSDKFWLPWDIQTDYIEQVRNEFIEQKKDLSGNTRLVYVKKEPNHYRSCENMCLGAAKLQNIENLLFDKSSVEILSNKPQVLTSGGDEDAEKTGNDSEYFSGRRGRRSW